MADINEVATKIGLPVWLAALGVVAAGAVGLTAVTYEKVRIPGLEGRIALQERELSNEKQRATQAEEFAIGWKRLYEELVNNVKTASDQSLDACSMVQHIRDLRVGKQAAEVMLGRVQVGQDNWNTFTPEERDKRVAELRREASDYQAQILAVSKCEK
ncbi:hypothetical protein [Variovorax sp. EBFNA2]|uniref:hypothetical protein n=1 Tax=Variovorax sp. EBFNA2 TaxID=3342097 RepID=UPI0029C0F1E4|nr:hypothetical protein [Variovorax boronicumulans]WPG39177.1 hypothetical protein RZE79_07555 [Variovorax boronicumulans]